VSYEVRCCCQPKKLLGWLDIPAVSGNSVVLALSSTCTWDPAAADITVGDAVRTVTLPIATIAVPGRGSYRAIKAEGVSMEVLRQVRGFTEA
jgi:hypothetical protein